MMTTETTVTPPTTTDPILVGPTTTAVVTTPPAVEKPVYPKTRPPLPDNGGKFDPDLLFILSQPRCHDSVGEKKFGEWLIKKLNSLKAKPAIRALGAITVEIGEGKTLFSCHIDTCHGKDEVDQYKLIYDASFEHLYLDSVKEEPRISDPKDPKWTSKTTYRKWSGKVASCLGADDGAGVWLMLKMIEAKIPGGYIFHRGEECGGLSAKAMAKEQVKWLEKWNAAVAFDRPRYDEVIINQGGQQCASWLYGDALSKALSWPEMAMKFSSSTKGVYTDTKEYRGIIAECVNIGVGYEHQHGPDEFLDYGHLFALLTRIKLVEWDKLPISRKPEIYQAPSSSYHGSSSGYSGPGWKNGIYQGHGQHNGTNGFDEADDHFMYGTNTRTSKKKGGKTGGVANFPVSTGSTAKTGSKTSCFEEPETQTFLKELYEVTQDAEDIMTWFEDNPEQVCKLMMRAILEGYMAELKYDMLVSKTLKA